MGLCVGQRPHALSAFQRNRCPIVTLSGAQSGTPLDSEPAALDRCYGCLTAATVASVRLLASPEDAPPARPWTRSPSGTCGPPSVTSPTGNVTRLPYRDGRQIASPTLPANGSRTTAGLAWFARRSSLFVRATGGSPATPAAHVLFPVIVPRPGPATRSRTSHVTRHNRDHVPFTTTALARGGFTFLPSSPGFDQHL